MVPALSHRVSRVPWYSGSCHALKDFGYGAFTLSCRSFQFRSPVLSGHSCSPNPAVLRTAVWAPPVPLAATPGITFVFFSSGYLDVSVHRVPSARLWIHRAVHGVSPCGFPHSDTRGSMLICSSPRLFAAYRVFLRLLVPRHPPCALSCLTCSLPSPPSVAVRDAPSQGSFFWFLSGSLFWFLRAPGTRPVHASDVLHILLSSLATFHAFLILKIFSVFGFQGTGGLLSPGRPRPSGSSPLSAASRLCMYFPPCSGLKWTRTTDLTLIRRAL